jgi:hypothetical protein
MGNAVFDSSLQNGIFARRTWTQIPRPVLRRHDDQRGFSIVRSVFNFAIALHNLATGRVIPARQRRAGGEEHEAEETGAT